LACTHILPQNLRLFNLCDGDVQFDATGCSTCAAEVFRLARRIHGVQFARSCCSVSRGIFTYPAQKAHIPLLPI
jgi:hypothetical protein